MFKPRCATSAILCCLLFASCRQSARDVPAEAIPPAAEARPDSWIGVALFERPGCGSEIREYGKHVEVSDTYPSAPADGLLMKSDVILRVGGRPVASYDDVVAVVRSWPAGQELEVTVNRADKEIAVRLRPEPKPAPEELLRRLYVGKPLPSFDGYEISIAEADGNGGIVPGSQCVMEKKKACPKFGRLGKTRLAVGKATVLLFWSQYDLDAEARRATPPVFAALKRWHERFGSQGLAVIALTSDTPNTLAAYLKTAGPQPPMTVISMFYGDYGVARFVAAMTPSVLVLDEKGVVRAAAGTIEDLAEIGDRVIPELLGTSEK